MHNIKEIRINFENFKKIMKLRNVETNLDEILILDKENRNFIQKKETLEMEKKKISKSKDESLFKKSKEISIKIEDLIKKQTLINNKLNNILSSIPNIPLNDVPPGKDENDNKEVSKSGEIKNYNFRPKTHYEIGKELNMLDFDLATKTTGSRFVFVKGKLAALERAISNFMMDTHTQINGYTEISPPLMATDDTMYGTGQLPKFENDQFEIKIDEKNDRKFLIPTAEVILTNMVKNKLINLNLLPMRLVASTPCFRKEAGSYGKDTKGMIRQHQFYKVELVSIVDNNKCEEELERMTNCATLILDKLKLPYRKIILNTGDMVGNGLDIHHWETFFDVTKDLMRSIPYFPTLGNHEKDSKYYYDFFNLPGNERYYSFSVGDALFISLDFEGIQYQTPDYINKENREHFWNNHELPYFEKQKKWLDHILTLHQDAGYIFVFFHQPLISVKKSRVKDSKIRRKFWGDIFERHGVQVVLSGHDHHYHHAIVTTTIIITN